MTLSLRDKRTREFVEGNRIKAFEGDRQMLKSWTIIKEI